MNMEAPVSVIMKILCVQIISNNNSHYYCITGAYYTPSIRSTLMAHAPYLIWIDLLQQWNHGSILRVEIFVR